MLEDLEKVFDGYHDEYIKFDSIENKLSQRPDLCALIYLDKIFPSNTDIISCSEHDEFFIGIEGDDLRERLNEEDVLYLTRCGVMYSNDYDCLKMFS